MLRSCFGLCRSQGNFGLSAWQFEQLTVIIDADFRTCHTQRIPQGNLVCSEYRSAEVVLRCCYYANGAEGVPPDEKGLRRGWNMAANPLVNLPDSPLILCSDGEPRPAELDG
jgi:hypothetical protein